MRKISGIVALCAILLLSLAPTASQSIAHARMESLLAAVCASDTPHASPDTSDALHAKHGAPDHLRACAYCDLIAHAPTPTTALHRTIIASPPRDAVVPYQSISAPRRALPAYAQPRAPPALA